MQVIVNHENNDVTLQWHECVSSIANVEVYSKNKSLYQHMIRNFSDHGSYNWFGIPGGVAAVRQAVELDGWQDGVDKGMALMEKFEVPQLPAYKRKRVRGAQGHSLDIHRVYAGDLPHAWESLRKEVRNNAVSYRGHVNVIIDLAASGGVGGEDMFWRGATGCIMAKALMDSGRSVRLITADSTARWCDDEEYERSRPKGLKRLTIAVVLKDFTQPLDLNNVFACTALAGFYRHYCFKSELALPYKVSSGFGSITRFNPDDLGYFLDGTPCIIVENIWNEEQALNRLKYFKEQVEGTQHAD